MKLELVASYSAASEVVLRAMTDRRFHEDKIRLLGAVQSEVINCSTQGAEFEIRIRRTMRNERPVPAGLRGLLPETSVVEHRDHWNAKTGRGTVAISIQGVPVELSCAIELAATTAGTDLKHRWDIRSRLPVIGGALEKFIAADLPRLMELETRAGSALLERYR
ncbi:DUF2505 domain-containing protein [Stagnimonas aquatica]|uniref:DUF2505 domain-containing protein n=1 Tax=Stagnimonas aquatica TaxID=2689987 RepID=A0A3N0V1U9_9GAMM|nr:DUF2505 domain-containing protein [Stagnimonas aquatica]ROH86786.1 DUF2505 domain-containing protein [Stagnimonas aquatica]